MSRIKRGKTTHKKRKNLLKYTKGFRWGRKSKFKAAKEALMKAWSYSYRDRRTKKREMRRLWNNKINAACRKNNTTYSAFIKNLHDRNIALDRKVLAQMAEKRPETFSRIVEKANSL